VYVVDAHKKLHDLKMHVLCINDVVHY